MAKAKASKTRQTVPEILARLSDRMFPAELGAARVTVRSREADGDGVLHNLLYGRELFPAQALIEVGADVDLAGNCGFTPLHVAVWCNDARAVEMLLDAGANPAMRNSDGQTPLDMAIEADHAEVVKRLNGPSRR
ncbi:ankyrin repeat domain-containing protein [Roseivivax sp. CAU 1753]